MGIIVKIAWRNLWRHKGKSLIVGTILFLGATIMTVGTGVTTGMDKGLRKHIVDGFTGDIVLTSKKQKTDNVFLNMMGQAIEPLPDYPKIKKLLANSPAVKSWLPIGKNMAMCLNDEGGSMDGAFLIGVDIKQYESFFNDNLELIQGRLLQPGEPGVMLATGSQKIFVTSMGLFFMPESTEVDTSVMPEEAKKNHDELVIKRSMIFMGYSDDNTSTDIRLPIRGLVKYRAMNSIFGAFIIIDIESYRHCMGYVSADYQTVTVPEESKKLLGVDSDNLDDLFSGGDILVDNKKTDEPVFSTDGTPDSQPTPAPVSSPPDIDQGTYDLVLVKLHPGVELPNAMDELTALFDDNDIGVRPVLWHKAIGTIGSLAMLMKTSLFIFVMLLFFVAIVIIINTLSMSALERTAEIGMMRAVGARKGFIGAMFLAETAVLASFFGSIGVVFGWITVTVLSALNLTTKNDMVQLIFGGDTFHPFLTPVDFLLVVIQLAFVAGIAVIYPLFVARNITPLDAISRE